MIINSEPESGPSRSVYARGVVREYGMRDDRFKSIIRFPIGLSAAVNDVKRARTTEWDDSIRWLDPDVVSAATCQRSH
jgi:hypothetical protein